LKLKKNFFWSFFNSGFIALSGLLSYSLLANNLSVSDFGKYGLIISILSFFIALGTFGMHLISSKIIHLSNTTINHKNRLIKTAIITIFFSSFLFFLIANYIDIFYSNNSRFTFVILFVLVFSIIQRIASDYFRSIGELNNFFLMNSIGSSAGLIVWSLYLFSILFLIFFEKLSIENIFISLLFSSLSTITLFIVFYFNHFIQLIYNFFKYLRYNDKKYNFFLNTSFGLLLIVLLKNFKENFSFWILGYFSSQQDVAIFFAVFKTLFFIYIPLVIIDIIFPQVIARINIEKNNYENIIRKISSYRALVSFFSIILIFFFSKEILYIIFGNEYTIGSQALKILIISLIPIAFLGPCHSIMILTKYEKESIIIDLVLLVPTIIFGIFLSKEFGFIGMILAYSFYIFFSNILYFIFVKYKMKINTLPFLGIKKNIDIIRNDFL
tara:strand:- start:8048 stop:9367 length:1320 start_codon:yes stop_codon:yes gene_type:complete